MRQTPATGLAALGMSDSALNAFAAALQGVSADGVSTELPSPDPSGLVGKVSTMLLLHLHLACRVAVDGDIPIIWEAVAQGKGRMEGIYTLNQALMLGLSYCCRVFKWRAHFSASLPPASVCKKT